MTTWWRQESTRRGRANTDRTLHHETQPHRSCAAPGDATPPTECAHSTLQPVSMQQTKTTGTPPSPAPSSPRRKHERRVPSISADATPIDHDVTHGPRTTEQEHNSTTAKNGTTAQRNNSTTAQQHRATAQQQQQKRNTRMQAHSHMRKEAHGARLPLT